MVGRKGFDCLGRREARPARSDKTAEGDDVRVTLTHDEYVARVEAAAASLRARNAAWLSARPVAATALHRIIA